VLTSDQLAIRDGTRKFVRDEIVPHILDWDAAGEVPRDVWLRLGHLGLQGICAPAEWGGAGGDFVSYALAVEELAYGDCAIANNVGGTNFPYVAALVKYGTEQQKRDFLKPVVAGDCYISLLLSEPHTGSDLSTIKTAAVRNGKNWIVNGEKVFVTGGATSGAAILLARTDAGAAKRGITAFLIRPGAPGYEVLRTEKKLGHRTIEICHIGLNGLTVPDDCVLGEVGGGYKLILEGLDSSRVGVAAQAVGVAQAAFDAALGYARERVTFGKPIVEHQALGFRLAEMETRIEAARQLYLHAARLKDEGNPSIKAASMAKLFASEMAEFVCSAALQVFGGAGYIQGSLVEKLYRDQRVLQIYEGTSEVLKLLMHRDLARTNGPG
jgi:alkylation response protein AidB-like acyl-CoA dehydrogenase